MPISTPRMSGVGHNLLRLLLALVADEAFVAEHDIVLITTVRGYRYAVKHEIPHVRYVKLPIPSRVMNRLPTLRLLPPLDAALGRGVYVFTNYRRWPLLGSPSLTVVHDVAFVLFPDSMTVRSRKLLERHVKRWALGSTKALTVSKSSKQEIVEHLKIPANHIEVVPNGVDANHFYKRPDAEVAAARKRYDLPSKYILFISNIEPRKNVLRLLKAYRSLPQDIKDIYGLVLVGAAGWLREEIDAEIATMLRDGDTIVQPSTYVTDDDLPAVVSGASLLAHPALHEGFGIPPLEGMACGVPVLTSRTPALMEVVGEAAILVDPESIESIRDGLVRGLTDDDLRGKLVANGRLQIQKYTWSSAAEKLKAIIARIEE